MNSHYEKLLIGLGVPSPIIDCGMGRIRTPLCTLDAPPEWYGFPPALIPIWSESINYLGLWKHWFTPRPLSYVRLYREFNKVEELARNAEQFLTYMTLYCLCATEDLPQTWDFARMTEIHNTEEIEQVATITGDALSGLTGLAQFRSETPLPACEDLAEYNGWFPALNSRTDRWKHTCFYEWPDDLREAKPTSVATPPWLWPQEDLVCVFEALLAQDDLHGAWLSLNAPGWLIWDATRALHQLARKAENDLFWLLCKGWTEMIENDNICY